jgi:4-hydroxybenzoyl-CoA reductase subunit beta
MIPLPKFRYVEPTTLAEAAAILAAEGPDCQIIGGGTDLVPSLRQGIFAPKTVLSLQAIGGLRALEWNESEGLSIGAGVTLRRLETDATVRKLFPMLAQAASEVASPSIRHMATLGGNLCLDTRCYYYNQSEDWKACSDLCLKVGGEFCKASPGGKAKKCFAVFSADVVPALIALKASVTLLSPAGERTLDLAAFYSGDGARPNALLPGEILTGVTVAADRVGVRGSYLTYRIRQTNDYPIAGVALAARLGPGQTASEVRLVLSGVASKPILVKGIAELFEGQTLDRARIEQAASLARKAAIPQANTAGQRDHRKRMIHEFTLRAFESLTREAP